MAVPVRNTKRFETNDMKGFSEPIR
jgi:hypothetical protein